MLQEISLWNKYFETLIVWNAKTVSKYLYLLIDIEKK